MTTFFRLRGSNAEPCGATTNTTCVPASFPSLPSVQDPFVRSRSTGLNHSAPSGSRAGFTTGLTLWRNADWSPLTRTRRKLHDTHGLKTLRSMLYSVSIPYLYTSSKSGFRETPQCIKQSPLPTGIRRCVCINFRMARRRGPMAGTGSFFRVFRLFRGSSGGAYGENSPQILSSFKINCIFFHKSLAIPLEMARMRGLFNGEAGAKPGSKSGLFFRTLD